MSTLRCVLLCTALVSLSTSIRAADDDKKGIFDTFYLDGETPTWIVTFRDDRTFDLISPDGKAWSGTMRVSNDEIGLRIDESRRHFSFKLLKNNDLELRATERDTPDSAGMLGQLPPVTRNARRRFIDKNRWIKAGRAVSVLPASSRGPDAGATGETSVVATVESKQPQEEATGKAQAEATENEAGLKPPESLIGKRFRLKDGQGIHELAFEEETYRYRAPDKEPITGTYFYFNGELSLDSETHNRALYVLQATRGVQLRRRVTDVLKANDVMGSMPPQANRLFALWENVQQENIMPLASANDLAPVSATAPVESSSAEAAARSQLLLQQGDAELARGNRATARRAYEEALRLDPRLKSEVDRRSY